MMGGPGLSRCWRVVVLGTCLCVAASARAQVFSREAEVVIPESPTLTDQIVVAGGPAVITDVNLVLNIEHGDLAQLDILLIPPGWTRYLVLSADTVGTDGGFVRTRFDDRACLPIYYGTGTYSATYQPERGLIIPFQGTGVSIPAFYLNGLTPLNGTSANGTWTLIVDDDTNGTTGILHCGPSSSTMPWTPTARRTFCSCARPPPRPPRWRGRARLFRCS